MMLISWKGLPDMFVAIIWNLALQQQHKSAPLDQIVYNMKIIKTIVTILKIWFWPILRFQIYKIVQIVMVAFQKWRYLAILRGWKLKFTKQIV